MKALIRIVLWIVGALVVLSILPIVLAETVRRLVGLFGGQTELGRGTIDMLSRTAGYSIEKAKEELGYVPHFSLEEGMRCTEDWVQSEGIVAKS